MATEKKTKQPNWKKWVETVYNPWYERNKPGGVNANSNPSDPPPPPPGPIKP